MRNKKEEPRFDPGEMGEMLDQLVSIVAGYRARLVIAMPDVEAEAVDSMVVAFHEGLVDKVMQVS